MLSIHLADPNQHLQIITDVTCLRQFIYELANESQCKLCPYTSKRRRNVERHLITVHAPRERVSCSFCNKSYKNSLQLNTHLKKIHGEGPISGSGGPF